jgi:hypothetical protein
MLRIIFVVFALALLVGCRRDARLPMVLQYSPNSAIPFIEVKSNGGIATYSSWNDMIPTGKALIIKDVEYTIRGPGAYAGKRVYFGIHLGPPGQGTVSFRTSVVLDASAEASGSHYMNAGMVIKKGDAIVPFPFVYPNNGSGNANMDITLRGVLVDLAGVQGP